MPQFQHRIGTPSRPKNSDNTRWAAPDPRLDWSDWLLIAAIIAAMVCAGMGVTVWSPEIVGGVR